MNLQATKRPGSSTMEQQKAISRLLDAANHHTDYYVQLIGAVLLAAGGIFADSVPVLIASMIVAPLASPLLTAGLSLTVHDWKLTTRMIGLLMSSCIIALALAGLLTVAFDDIRVNDVYVTFTENNALAFFIALVSGAIATFCIFRPRIAPAVTGVAIAVSLLPPLTATGVGLASADVTLATNAFTLFLLNVAGIVIASAFTFSLFVSKQTYKA